MNYSRSARRQLILCDLIEGVIDAARAANRSDTVVDQIVRRLSQAQGRIRSMLAEVNDRGGLVFESRKEHRRYERELVQVRETILSSWCGEELDGREYVNALLVLMEDVWAQAGRTRQAWARVIDELQRLYLRFDPGLEAEDQMEFGEAVAQKLEAV